MKITKAQIQNLYAFTRKHYVVYYDLQTELVDHLANDIEAIWQQQPKLSYEEARNKAFKKFGIFGFMEPIAQREKAMSKRYINYLLTDLKQWFTIPKCVITLLLLLLFYTVFSSVYGSYFFIAAYAIICVWTFYKSLQLKKHYKQRKKQSNKKWLLEDIIFKQAGGAAIVLISALPSWYNITQEYFNNFYFVLGVSIFTTLFYLWLYISFKVIPNKAETLLKDTYPEYNM